MQEATYLTASTVGLLRNVLALADLERALAACLVVDGARAHAVLDLLGHGQEGLLDVGRRFGRSLKEWNLELVGKLLGGGVFYHLFVGQIRLVADQQLVDAFTSVSVDFLEPLLDVAESIVVCDIVDHNDTVSASVIRGSDRTESLLSGRVPLYSVRSTRWGEQASWSAKIV